MSKTSLFAGVALLASAAIALAGSASASVTFVSLGAIPDPGFMTLFNGSSAANLSFTAPAPCALVTGTCSGITSGNVFNAGGQKVAAEPLLSTGYDTSPYLAVEPGSPVTVTTIGDPYKIAIYVGSLDSFNNLNFNFEDGGSADTYTGQTLAALTSAVDGGKQGIAADNGLFTFTFTHPVTSFVISDNIDKSAFEIAYIGEGVPEPASWALMLIGVGGIGGAMRLQRRRSVVAC